jgi:hypothetical protein
VAPSEGGAKSAGGFRPPPGGGPVVIPGEHTVEIAGRTVALGDKLILRPGVDRDPYDKMLHGRVATLERVYVDTNNKVYLGVTVDDDAAQEILRESGRYLFFFLPEVEVA